MMKLKSLLLAAIILTTGAAALALPQRNQTAPDAVVRNLYAAHKSGQGPFFQTRSRALLDRYFTKEMAGLLWHDAATAKGEVGAIDFDPLYNAQDTKVTAFRVGRPQYGEGNLDLADVPVTFKNMGKAETVLFRLEREGPKAAWRISDIYYPTNPEAASSLKAILSAAMKS